MKTGFNGRKTDMRILRETKESLSEVDAKTQVSDWRKQENEQRAKLKASLEKKHGVVGHKHADTLFGLAWSMGHTHGFSEVEILYEEMADLLK